MKNKRRQVVELFKRSKDQESEKIELDNLDRAKLTYDDLNEVVVENEHGTQFPLDDLSEVELNIFLYILKH